MRLILLAVLFFLTSVFFADPVHSIRITNHRVMCRKADGTDIPMAGMWINLVMGGAIKPFYHTDIDGYIRYGIEHSVNSDAAIYYYPVCYEYASICPGVERLCRVGSGTNITGKYSGDVPFIDSFPSNNEKWLNGGWCSITTDPRSDNKHGFACGWLPYTIGEGTDLGVASSFKVLTINMKQDIESANQTRRTAELIKKEYPDIVAVQASGGWDHGDRFQKLVKELGVEWSGMQQCSKIFGVITRHKVLGMSNYVSRGINVRVRLNTGLEISVWSLLLNWQYSQVQYASIPSAATILRHEMGEGTAAKSRIHSIIKLLEHPAFIGQIKNSRNVPVIVAGQFLTPSHLDWTEATKSNHNGIVFEWPVTKLLSENAGMTDSYREVYPDPVKDTGFTSIITNPKTGGIMRAERTSYIFYRGFLRATLSKVIDNFAPSLGGKNNGADKSVLTEFEILPYKNEAMPSFQIDTKYIMNETVPNSTEKCEETLLHA